jgi:hypothetical protein
MQCVRQEGSDCLRLLHETNFADHFMKYCDGQSECSFHSLADTYIHDTGQTLAPRCKDPGAHMFVQYMCKQTEE